MLTDKMLRRVVPAISAAATLIAIAAAQSGHGDTAALAAAAGYALGTSLGATVAWQLSSEPRSEDLAARQPTVPLLSLRF